MKCQFRLVLVVVATATLLLPTAGTAQDRTGVEQVSHGGTQFAIDLYRLMNDGGNENLFLSPYGIYTVLSLLYAGATGETADQMAAALNVGSDPTAFHAAMVETSRLLAEIEERGDLELSIANSLWPQSGMAINQEFLELAGDYGSELVPVDYRREASAARESINEWGAEHTNNRIKEIITWDLPPDTYLLLANAIFFKGNWASQFDKARTTEEPFYRSNGGTVSVPMMNQLGEFGHGYVDSVELLELAYEGGDLSMLIVLPLDTDGLDEVEQSMTGDDVIAWSESLYPEPVEVYLPRFTIMSDFDLVEHGDLASLGMTNALHPDLADFSGMISNPYFYIRVFVQKSFVDVNEEGTEAAAATAVVVALKSAAPRQLIFRADRPFIFLIRDTTSGSVL
ncbi:MAG: serpin family protein, partial [Spirochaetaceae bacterium]|nr:serpin family protein [Spirochaetaceae bacterium]